MSVFNLVVGTIEVRPDRRFGYVEFICVLSQEYTCAGSKEMVAMGSVAVLD